MSREGRPVGEGEGGRKNKTLKYNKERQKLAQTQYAQKKFTALRKKFHPKQIFQFFVERMIRVAQELF